MRDTPESSAREALASHLETWASHCGAPRSVYEGHLNKLLEAVRVAAEEVGAAREREAIAGLFASGEFCKMPDHPRQCLCSIIESAIRARAAVDELKG